jgi:hypothetical protein
MNELLLVLALVGAGEQGLSQHHNSSESELRTNVIQSYVPRDIINNQVHIGTGMIGVQGVKMQCWPTNIYQPNGSVITKIQCN